LALLGAAALPTPEARTITVRQDGSGDYTTIQAAVAFADSGDTVEVGPGTYTGRLDVYHDLTVRSTHGPGVTAIDGEDIVRAFQIHMPVLLELDGLTFVNSHQQEGYRPGIGSYLGNGSLTARDCVFSRSAVIWGATSSVPSDAFMHFTDCRFEANHRGITVSAYIRSTFERCQFIGNSGGTVLICASSYMTVKECLFIDNSAPDDVAAIKAVGTMLGGGGVLLQQSTFYGNHSMQGKATVSDSWYGSISAEKCIFSGETGGWALSGDSYCNVYWDNAQGNILNGTLDPTDRVADPQFCGAPSGDFTVAATSPAAAANSGCRRLVGAYPVGCAETPTLISVFRAENSSGGVRLDWDIISDDMLAGFRIVRADALDGSPEMFPETGFLPPTTRSYVDESVEPGNEYTYALIVVRQEGDDVRSVPVSVSTPIAAFSLAQNAPNPFHPRTSISYTLARPAEVRLDVFTVDGRRVRTLASGHQGTGTRTITWDGRDAFGRRVASGVYFYRLQADGRSFTRKMSLLR